MEGEEEDVGGASDDPLAGNGLGMRVVERIDAWYKHRVQVGLLDERAKVRGESKETRVRTGKSRR